MKLAKLVVTGFLFSMNAFAQTSVLVKAGDDLALRGEPTKKHLLDRLTNEIKDDRYFITQKEGQEIIRIIHRDQLSSLDVMNLKNNILADSRFAALSFDQKDDLEKFMTDVSIVRSRMSEFEAFEKLHCRFALRDNPMEEVPNDSLAKDPERYSALLTSKELKDLQDNKLDRAVVGFCWSQADRDPLNSWTEEVRKNQFK